VSLTRQYRKWKPFTPLLGSRPGARADLVPLAILRAMRFLLAVAALGVLLAAPAGADPVPTLRAAAGRPPLTLVGRGFVPGEHLKIAVFGDRVRTARLVAGRDGTFVVRFAVAAKTCLVWRATVVGSRSGRSTFHAPVVRCAPEGGVSAPVGPAPRVGTGIAGAVRRGPITPVCVAGAPCDGPAPGVTVTVESGRTTIARLLTGADGRFVVHVPPGAYVVRVSARHVAPAPVRVRAGAFVNVSLSIDTGIR
jgi:hypothetical protein